MNGRADVVQHNSYFVCTCLLRCAADGRRVIRQFRRCKFTDFFVAESSLQEQNAHVQAVLQTADRKAKAAFSSLFLSLY